MTQFGEPEAGPRDEKYVVFKREELEAMIGEDLDADMNGFAGWVDDHVLNDAVVIRTGDVLAGPALHMYAASAALQQRAGGWVVDGPICKQYQRVADYFHGRAVEADERFAAGDVKVPD